MGGRRPLVLSALVAAVLGLAPGCSRTPGRLYPDRVDLARAQRVWADPWAAPLPEAPDVAFGSDGRISRWAGRRQAVYTGTSPRRATALEVAAAQHDGWGLVAASCRRSAVVAVLARGGDDLDRVATARLRATRVPGGASGGAEVTVDAAVPHHLDDRWPVPADPVPVSTTCVGQGSARGSDEAVPPVPFAGRPLRDDHRDVDRPEWPGDRVPARTRALVEAVEADPWFASAGLAFDVPEEQPAGARRFAPRVVATLHTGATTPTGSVRSTVDEMTGWEPTWAACGARRTAEATLRLVTSAGTAAARLAADPRRPGRVAVDVRLPVPTDPTSPG